MGIQAQGERVFGPASDMRSADEAYAYVVCLQQIANRRHPGKIRPHDERIENEADQFLSSRSQGAGTSADQMHNQMQNIFLEQIEKFQGILIATTNLLENIDQAFSRRFNYKIEFKKPDQKQRLMLWKMMLPKNAPYESDFDIDKLSSYPLTGGQINLIVKNTAYHVAARKDATFRLDDFIAEIQKERTGSFEGEKSVGFLNR